MPFDSARAGVKTARKRPVNVSLDESLVGAAKALGVKLSRACEIGLRQEIAAAQELAWIAENRAAIDASNAYVETHDLPLAVYRQF